MSQREVSFAVRVVGRATEQLNKINRSLERLTRPIAKVNETFKTAERNVRRYTRSLNNLENKLKGIGQAVTIGLTIPLAAAGATSINTAANFQHAMTKVKTLTKGQMFESLKNQAREFGATTLHSATEAANAMVFYSMAGFKANETYKAMPATLALATAATEELSKTADIFSGVISAYDVPLGRIESTADMLTAGFANAKMDLDMLGEAVSKAGGTFNKLGIPLSELISLIGKLRSTNISPESIGVALASASARLIDPVKKVRERVKALLNIDASTLTTEEGKLGSFVGLLERLDQAGAKPADYSAIFGLDAGKYIMQLQGATKEIRDLQDTIQSSTGITRKFAREFQTGATGAMYAFKSAIEAVQISIAESGLLDFFTRNTLALTEYIQALSRVNPSMLKLGTIIAVVVGVIGPLLLGLASLVGGLASTIVFLKAASAVAVMFGTTLLAVIGGVLLKIAIVVGAIAGIGYAIWFVAQNWNAAFEFIGNILSSIWDSVVGVVNFILSTIKEVFTGYLKFFLWIGKSLENLWEDPKRAVVQAFGDIYTTIAGFVEKAVAKFQMMTDPIVNSIKRIMNYLIDPTGKYVEFIVEEDLPDLPSIENETIKKTIDYGMGPLQEEVKVNFSYDTFEPKFEEQTVSFIPEFLTDIGTTVSEAFSNPVFDLNDKIEIDIDEERLGKNIDLKPKIDTQESNFSRGFLKPFGPGDFYQQSQEFNDLSRVGGKNWSEHVFTEVAPTKPMATIRENSLFEKESYTDLRETIERNQDVVVLDIPIPKPISIVNEVLQRKLEPQPDIQTNIVEVMNEQPQVQPADHTMSMVNNLPVVQHNTTNIVKDDSPIRTLNEKSLKETSIVQPKIDTTIVPAQAVEVENQIAKPQIELIERVIPTNVIPFPMSSERSKDNDSLATVTETNERSEVLERVSNHTFEKDRVEKIISRETVAPSERQQEKEVRIIVDFENLPKGVDVRTTNRSKVPLKVNMGFAMDGTR